MGRALTAPCFNIESRGLVFILRASPHALMPIARLAQGAAVEARASRNPIALAVGLCGGGVWLTPLKSVEVASCVGGRMSSNAVNLELLGLLSSPHDVASSRKALLATQMDLARRLHLIYSIRLQSRRNPSHGLRPSTAPMSHSECEP